MGRSGFNPEGPSVSLPADVSQSMLAVLQFTFHSGFWVQGLGFSK